MKQSKLYEEQIQRNIGILTKKQQEKLRKSCIGVFGLGGLGGSIAEILARTGVGHLKILDSDCFEASNINRQIFAFRSTIGKLKTDVTEKFLKDINPEIKIEKFTNINKKNAEKIVKGCDAIALALDGIEGYIITSRATRKLNIPLIEGWAIPYGNVRVITKSTPSLEEIYNLPTIGKDIDSVDKADLKKSALAVLKTLTEIQDVPKFYSKETMRNTLAGKAPPRSFAPMVWLTSVIMALEVLKIVLNMGKISYAPDYAIYDPYYNRIPKQKGKKWK